MKVFILLAIIFFSWRVFSADGYYYEGRYYKIDEYIRSVDDPNYQAFMNEKKVHAQKQRVGVEHYFAERDKAAIAQEKSRQAFVNSLVDTKTNDKDLLKKEAEHEKYLEAEEKRQSQIQAQYLYQRDAEMLKLKPSSGRMIASVNEFSGDQPMKRIPRDKRKFVLHGKDPSAPKRKN